MSELDFGTGCVKITPCHDPNDFEVGLRHNLPQYLHARRRRQDHRRLQVDGMDRYEARKAIVQELEEQGYLVSIDRASTMSARAPAAITMWSRLRATSGS